MEKEPTNSGSDREVDEGRVNCVIMCVCRFYEHTLTITASVGTNSSAEEERDTSASYRSASSGRRLQCGCNVGSRPGGTYGRSQRWPPWSPLRCLRKVHRLERGTHNNVCIKQNNNFFFMKCMFLQRVIALVDQFSPVLAFSPRIKQCCSPGNGATFTSWKYIRTLLQSFCSVNVNRFFIIH